MPRAAAGELIRIAHSREHARFADVLRHVAGLHLRRVCMVIGALVRAFGGGRRYLTLTSSTSSSVERRTCMTDENLSWREVDSDPLVPIGFASGVLVEPFFDPSTDTALECDKAHGRSTRGRAQMSS